jgi:hypothetical protein
VAYKKNRIKIMKTGIGIVNGYNTMYKHNNTVGKFLAVLQYHSWQMLTKNVIFDLTVLALSIVLPFYSQQKLTSYVLIDKSV